LLGYDPIGEMQVLRPGRLAAELGLIEADSAVPRSVHES